MYSLADLGKTVADIQEHNKSGVLMISGQSPSKASRTQTFSLRFEEGDLARASSAGSLLGQAALLELVAQEQWMSPRWFPLSTSAGWRGHAQVKRPDLMGLLGQVNAPAGTVATEAIDVGPSAGMQAQQPRAADQAADALVKRMHAVFSSVYLGDTVADLAQTAQLHPPATDPQAYREACIRMLEPMLGAQAARAMVSA